MSPRIKNFLVPCEGCGYPFRSHAPHGNAVWDTTHGNKIVKANYSRLPIDRGKGRSLFIAAPFEESFYNKGKETV